MTTTVVFNFVRVSENICTFASRIFTQSMDSMSPQCHCVLAEMFNKEVSNVLCEKPFILVEFLPELRVVVIQDSEDGKRTVGKKYGRKIVNCYRMFADLREALAGVRALDKAKDL